jgi:hypothetical protein
MRGVCTGRDCLVVVLQGQIGRVQCALLAFVVGSMEEGVIRCGNNPTGPGVLSVTVV